MTDPLGSGGLADAVGDAKTLVTGTYVPVMIGAILFGVALKIGFKWLGKATRRAGG